MYICVLSYILVGIKINYFILFYIELTINLYFIFSFTFTNAPWNLWTYEWMNENEWSHTSSNIDRERFKESSESSWVVDDDDILQQEQQQQ